MERRDFLRATGLAAAGALVAPSRGVAEPLRHTLRQPCLGPADQRFWRLIRQQFHLAPGTAYLNTAGLGASPFAVTSVLEAATEREEASPSATHSEPDWARIRGKVARFLGDGCSPDEIALVSTATEGINLILNGLGLGRGDEVITSTHEHPAVNIPLLHKMQTASIVIRTFEPDLARGAGNVERIERLLTPRTRLILVSDVTCTTGQILPARAIVSLAAPRGVRVALDGAQSYCQFPIDIAATGADYYTASCHKWILGPKRTGLLYVRRDRIATLTPSIVGAYSDQAWSMAERRLDLRSTAQRFEFGTQNDALIYGLEAAADFVGAIGLEAVWAHNRSLTEACREGLRANPGVELLSPAEPQYRSAMITFRLSGRDNREVAAELGRRHLRVRSVTEANLDAVRASFHVHNEMGEADQLVREVAAIAAGRQTAPAWSLGRDPARP